MQTQPEKGFYYHFKHDPNGGVNNYAYEVLGTAFNSESAGFDSWDPNDFIDEAVVVYRALYPHSFFYKNNVFTVRPLKMFMESVTRDGKNMPRFKKITDEKTISELTAIRDAMYK